MLMNNIKKFISAVGVSRYFGLPESGTVALVA